MAVSHVFSNAVANWTGTATVFNSQGSTTTVAATALVRPQDWNSVHNQFSTLTGNTSLNSTASGTNIVLQGVGGITLVGSTNTIGISANPGVTYQYFDPYNEAPEIYLPMTNGTIFVDPQQMPNIQHDRIGIRMFYTNNAASTGSATFSFFVGLYTRNVSTLSLLASTSSAYAITFSGANSASIHQGPRIATIPWTRTITAGDYWVGLGISSSSAGANATMSIMQASVFNSNFSGIFNAASNATNQPNLGEGKWTGASAVPPASIAFSHIQATTVNHIFPPKYIFLSQTA